MEIDVVVTLPNGFKLGIEYCGIYWHSELFRNNKYHKHKLDAANANGYTLIQIFEDEWRDRKDIIKSIILQYLGNNSSIIYARKCKIEHFNKTPNKFLELNHIQGKANSSYSYGLIHNSETVAVCTFSRSRFGKGWECVRYCNKLNTTVVGGFGRLLNQFIKDVDPSEIVSYADCRYFTGDVYLKNGFTQDKVIPVGYFYIPKGFQERLNRIKFQKHKLKNMPSYDIKKTEVQIMTEEGYTRIFDAGQKAFRRKLHI